MTDPTDLPPRPTSPPVGSVVPPATAAPRPYAGPPAAAHVAASMPSASETKGFFGALFDFSFHHFVAIKLVKIVYIIELVLLVLSYIAYLIFGFAVHPVLGVVALIFYPVVAIVNLALFRFVLEFIVATIRTAENTAILAKAA